MPDLIYIINQAKSRLPLIGIIIFVLLVANIGVENIINAFLSVDPIYAFIVFLLVVPYALLKGYRLHYILKRQGIDLDFYFILKTNMIGEFYSTITPGRIGSLMRIPYLKRQLGKSTSECSGGVVIDKVSEVFAILILSVMGSLLILEKFSNVFYMMSGTLAISIVLLFIFINKQRSSFFLRFFYRHVLPKKLKESAYKNFHSFYENLPRPKELVLPLILSILVWTILYTQLYLFALGLGTKVPYLNFLFLLPITAVVGLIPVTVGGIGTREVSLIFLLSIYGVSAATTITISLFGYLVNIALALTGFYLSLREK